MSALDDAKAQVSALEKQERLEERVRKAAEAYEAEPTEANYRAHNRATEALAEHRSSNRPAAGTGPSIGGDAQVSEDQE